jgi:hypothetical protein
MASVMQAQSAADPIAEVLAGFGTHRARIDHAFIKMNLPERDLALLIEIAMRRRQRRRVAEVGALVQSAGEPLVQRASFPRSSIHLDADGALNVANLWLGAQGSRGTIGPISWDLVFQAAGPLVEPHVIGGILRPFDLRLRSVPDALISGNLSVGGQRFSFSHEPGTVSAFHGRRNPDRWVWISANAFDRPGVSVECVMLDSSIFGLPVLRARVGYFHLHTPETTMTVMHPLTGQVRVEGKQEDLTIMVRPRQGMPIVVHCVAPPASFRDFGDNVFATLLANCAITGIAQAHHTTGIVSHSSTR